MLGYMRLCKPSTCTLDSAVTPKPLDAVHSATLTWGHMGSAALRLCVSTLTASIYVKTLHGASNPLRHARTQTHPISMSACIGSSA